MGTGSIAGILFGAAAVGYVAGYKKRVYREHAVFCEADVMLKHYNAKLKDSKLDQSIAETKLSMNKVLEETQRIRMQVMDNRLEDLENELEVTEALLKTLTSKEGELK